MPNAGTDVTLVVTGKGLKLATATVVLQAPGGATQTLTPSVVADLTLPDAKCTISLSSLVGSFVQSGTTATVTMKAPGSSASNAAVYHLN